MATGN